MKKLFALLLALAMVMALAACASGTPAETDAPTNASNEEPTAAPTEAVEVPAFAIYTFVEDRGDLQVTWTLTIMGDVYSLEEYNSMAGESSMHGLNECVVDTEAGTITTGAWSDTDSNKSEFFAPDGSCTWVILTDGSTGEGTFEPANLEEVSNSSSEGSVNPGKYTYVDGDTTWVIIIGGNGSCSVSEYETASFTGENDDGLVVAHTCRPYDEEGNCWVDNGDGTFETGEWEPEERDDNHPSADYTSPNGVTVWKVVDAENSLAEPTEKVETFSYYGALSYASYSKETGEDWRIMIMGNGDCTIQLWDSEGHRVSEYVPKGFRVDDATHFTVFPFEDDAELPPFLSENAMTQWEVVDGENMVVEFLGTFAG